MNFARTVVFLFVRFLSPLLIFSISLGPLPAGVYPELSREVLRPMLDQAGLEQDLRPAGMEEDGELALIRKVQKQNDSEAMREILRMHRGLIFRNAKKAYRRLANRGISWQEALSTVELAVWKAVRDFDFGRRVKLSTYMNSKIQKELQVLRLESPASVFPVTLVRGGFLMLTVMR